jgi:Arf/Sar family protein
MGNALKKLFDRVFGNKEMRVRVRRHHARGRASCAWLRCRVTTGGASLPQVVMLGLDAAGKTTILYKLHIGEVLSTVPTIGARGARPRPAGCRSGCAARPGSPALRRGALSAALRRAAGFNVEKVQYKNVVFTVWDVGGQEKLRPLWKHYFKDTDALIYVVDCLDRDRIDRAKAEFQARRCAAGQRRSLRFGTALTRARSAALLGCAGDSQRPADAQRAHPGACQQAGHGACVRAATAPPLCAFVAPRLALTHSFRRAHAGGRDQAARAVPAHRA